MLQTIHAPLTSHFSKEVNYIRFITNSFAVTLANSSSSFNAQNNCSLDEDDDIISTWPLLHCPPLQTKTTVETWTGMTFSHQPITHSVWNRQARVTSYILPRTGKPEETGIRSAVQLGTPAAMEYLYSSCQSSSASGRPPDTVTLVQGHIFHTDLLVVTQRAQLSQVALRTSRMQWNLYSLRVLC